MVESELESRTVVNETLKRKLKDYETDNTCLKEKVSHSIQIWRFLTGIIKQQSKTISDRDEMIVSLKRKILNLGGTLT